MEVKKQTLTEKEAAIYCGVSCAFLRQSRCDGNLKGRTQAPPWIKAGRKVLYLISDLDNWLDQNRQVSVP